MKFAVYRLDGCENETFLAGLELELGVSIAMRSVYRAWNRCRADDDLAWFAALAESPRDVLLTWEPWLIPPAQACPEEQPDFSLRQILSGRYDDYLCDVARILASLPVKVYLRPMHEMNGNWYPWCGTVNGNTPAEYVSVWRHVRDVFRREHADAVRWVWSPYVFSYPDITENGFDAYYPGDDAVDLVGLDGYNWGNETEWGKWQSFSELFGEAYARVTELSARPVLIAETASAEGGGDKAAWLADMLEQLTSGYPRVEAVSWFDIQKECDWRIQSSIPVLELFRERASRLFGEPRHLKN